MKWEQKRLGDFCSLVNGKAFRADDWSESGLPIIRIQNLNDSTKPFNYWANGLDRQVHVQKRDLLIAWSGTPGTSFGAHIWNGPEGVLNQHIFRVDLTNGAVTKEWLKFCVNIQLMHLIDKAHGGVGLKHVTKGAVEGVEIPLPPMAEQKRIAGILDAADALRAKRREALAQLDSLLQATFLDLFGDPVNNPRGWNVRKLGEVAGFHAGSTLPASVPYAGQDGGYLSLKVSDLNLPENATNVSIAQLWTAKSSGGITAPPKSVVIPKRGGAIGTNKKRLLSRPAVLDPNLMAISAGREINHLYLYRWFHTFDLTTLTSGSTVPQLNKRDLSPLDIQTPPLSVQEQFAKVVEGIAHQRVTLNTHLAELDTLFASLQSRAFRGEL